MKTLGPSGNIGLATFYLIRIDSPCPIDFYGVWNGMQVNAGFVGGAGFQLLRGKRKSTAKVFEYGVLFGASFSLARLTILK